MFEIRNQEQKPTVLIRQASAKELAVYEQWKQENNKNSGRKN